MSASVKINSAAINKIKQAYRKAAIKTANAIIEDVEQAGTVPMQEGFLQSSGSVVPQNSGDVDIQYSTPYAWVQYFDASLDHSKGPHAGTARDHWLEPYFPGGEKHKNVINTHNKNVEKELINAGATAQ